MDANKLEKELLKRYFKIKNPSGEGIMKVVDLEDAIDAIDAVEVASVHNGPPFEKSLSDIQFNSKLISQSKKMLEVIEKALSISDLWMPSDENISEEFRDELEAIESMYQNFKNIVNTVTSK